MSKAKQKGTEGENEILALLHEAGIEAHRTEASKESHDIWMKHEVIIEVKFRRAWHLFGWIRKIRQVASSDSPWVIFAIHGDRRSKEGREVGRVAVFDADFAVELLELWSAWNDHTAERHGVSNDDLIGGLQP
tara:strand:- start:5242 stop:5640 length:399 start_codon:yes stop_codon:yes gene_type:complete